MKRVLRILLKGVIGFVAVLAVVVGGFFAYVYGVLPKKRAPQALTAETTPENVARGRYLAESVYQCLWCHSEVDVKAPGAPVIAGTEFAGRDWRPEMPDMPPDFQVFTANITSDRKVGVGAWSDGELVRAIREGIDKDGKAVFDLMPYATYHDKMSDADALAIVAYLRSLSASSKPMSKTTVGFPVPVIIRFFPKPVETPYPGPPTTPAERGAWLLDVAACHFCHDAHDEGHQAIAGRALAGGDPWKLRDGTELISPNISSDKALGIGAMTDADLRRVLDEGVGRSGKPLRWMPWTRYRTMNQQDKDAIVAALRSSPATK